MARRSPQTERLVEVVELLADCRGATFRLADLARLVGTDKATCYPMLTELTRLGWLLKDPAKRTYRLGPKLVRIGEAAAQSLELADAARHELSRLSQELGDIACLLVPSADDLLIAEVISPAERPTALNLRPGDRLTFRPPVGAILMAWSNFYALNVWLNRDPAFAKDPTRHQAILQALRERHFAVERFPVPAATVRDASAKPDAHSHGERRAAWLGAAMDQDLLDDLSVTHIDDARSYEILSITAAIFDTSGSAVGAVGIADLLNAVTGAELRDLGARVVEAGEKITARIDGTLPWTMRKRRRSW